MGRLFKNLRDANIVIHVREHGRVKRYTLEGRERWLLGRVTPGNKPDIPLKSTIAGRTHGEFLLLDGQLFYVDKGSINGTYLNGKKISGGLKGRANPMPLSGGDVLVIDGNSERSDPENVQIEIEIRQD